ncbi:TetR/AcrR family transcriptional regulator [Nocardioides sp. ChNu-153]|uniref:TetR/AcrR family transcriptional regulator n=1 Tax=unclassified Nocardioides TaxID=2615069 RepID=UPI002406BC28|nr:MULTISPECIES: TetR/AcrR family transcriptional regulator [unclassified Nocardioides]MDF9715595.1 TetR/AcrR family transcriptional regulator [Nocardioides sp. ChNu-99]MDN7121267.1 TetR/AcrR family transcriptional regulator [Nocardioides sp. ChNu-153]
MPPLPTDQSEQSDRPAPSAGRTARALARAELTRAILDSARHQLAEVGPAGLSLRAVARDLDMASSAVYRYFANRDTLLTALLVRTYDDLGAAAEEADAGPGVDPGTRLVAVGRAFRAWARAHPHEYALLYGSPVPGYVAPADTVAPATRITRVLLDIAASVPGAADRPADPAAHLDAVTAAAIAPVATLTDRPLAPESVARSLHAWATLVGAVSLELFGHLHRAVLDHDAHFEHVLRQVVTDLGA